MAAAITSACVHGAPNPAETADLEARVRHRLGGRLRDFSVTAGNAGLILRGYACSYHVKQLAQHAVTEATPLPIQANQIEVLTSQRGGERV